MDSNELPMKEEDVEGDMVYMPYMGHHDWREYIDDNCTRFEPDGRIVARDFDFYKFLLENNLREEAKAYLSDRWSIEYVAVARRVPTREFVERVNRLRKLQKKPLLPVIDRDSIESAVNE